MCKCKSLLESCYWHCCEKHFCWDEEIALYEEPKDPIINEHNNNAFDNLAFYDNVALIANRAIFTIEPLTNTEKPIVEQPKKKLRWFEDDDLQNNKVNEIQIMPQKKMSIVPEESDTTSIDTVDFPADDKKETVKEAEVNNTTQTEPKPTVQLRRKPLHQRRLSRALTLQIDRKELPLIRQSSMPKFYINTPEINQIDSCVARTPSITLNTPIRPQVHEFNYDLNSVVQRQKEQQTQTKPMKPEVRRVTSLKERIKRQSSLISLPSSITSNHM